MHPSDPESRLPHAVSRLSPRVKKLASVAFFLLGLALLGAAIWTIVRHAGAIEEARSAARGASPWLIAACLILPVVNWLTTSAAIWVVTGRYGKVRPGEMAALIGAAWLLNMLPMRPGMVGRVAYHKLYNGIPVRDCVRAIVAAIICTGASLALFLVAVALAVNLGAAAGAWRLGLLVAGPTALLAAATALLRSRGHAWRWPAAIGFRYLDIITWAVRYAIVFAIIGRPIGLMGAGAMTAVGQVAMLTPVQLGLREWAVGMASTGLASPGTDPATPAPSRGVKELVDAAAPGLLADCLMRAAELVVVIPVGVVSSAWVFRRMRAAGPKDEPVNAQESRRAGH